MLLPTEKNKKVKSVNETKNMKRKVCTGSIKNSHGFQVSLFLRNYI